MRSLPAVAAAAVALLALGGCGSSATDASGSLAQTPSDATPTAVPTETPTAVPAAPGEVTTGYAVTVIQQGDQPVQMCLGPTTAIYPPDCSGPEVAGWDWSDWDRSARDYAVVGGTTFGQFALTGDWDGSTLTVTDAVPGRSSPDFAEAPPSSAPPSGASRDELRQVLREVEDLPGLGVADVRGGRVHVDVTYDDGSLQAWCDQEYGDGVVVVSPELFDVG